MKPGKVAQKILDDFRAALYQCTSCKAAFEGNKGGTCEFCGAPLRRVDLQLRVVKSGT